MVSVNEPTTSRCDVTRHIRRRLIAGAMLLVPLVVTVVVLRFIFQFIFRFARPLGRFIAPQETDSVWLTVVSLAALFLLMYVAGTCANWVVGRRCVSLAERFLGKIPLVRTIYASARQVVDAVGASGKKHFRSVAFLDFPTPGITSIGFVVGEIEDDAGRPCYTLFVPLVPNITSGFLLVMPRSEVRLAALSVEEGIRLVLSSGILAPAALNRRRPET